MRSYIAYKVQRCLKITLGLIGGPGDEARDNDYVRLLGTLDSCGQGIRTSRLVKTGEHPSASALDSYKDEVETRAMHQIQSGLGQQMQGCGKTEMQAERAAD